MKLIPTLLLAAWTFNAHAWFMQKDRFLLGKGLDDTPNPASAAALYADSQFLIVGDQMVTAGRYGQVLVYTNNAGAWVFAQTLVDQVFPTHAGWFGYRVAYWNGWIAVGSTHAWPNGAHSIEGNVQMWQWNAGTRAFEYKQFIHPSTYSENSDDEFGDNLAMADGWMVVSAPWYDATPNTDSDEGAVWSYQLVNGVWTERQGPFAGSDTTPGDMFGIGVEVNSTNLFAGGMDTANGKVYWFTNSGTTWVQMTTITPTAPRAAETFGISVIRQSGDQLMVGAPMRNSTVFIGGVYFFTLTQKTYTQTFYYTPVNDLDQGPKTFFCNSGDMNGNIAVAGVRFADNFGLWNVSNQATNALGRVYVFAREGGTWRYKNYLAPGDRQPGDWFGSDVSTDGTNIYAISSGASSGGSDTMIFYSFTNRTFNSTLLNGGTIIIGP